MRGGAPGSGAPHGNKNALKHGLYTRDAIEERRQLPHPASAPARSRDRVIEATPVIECWLFPMR
jgi:hypothetical protein